MYRKLLEIKWIPKDLLSIIVEYGGEYKVSFVGKFGSKGSEAGQFKYPYGIAILDNQIYVAD